MCDWSLMIPLNLNDNINRDEDFSTTIFGQSPWYRLFVLVKYSHEYNNSKLPDDFDMFLADKIADWPSVDDILTTAISFLESDNCSLPIAYKGIYLRAFKSRRKKTTLFSEPISDPENMIDPNIIEAVGTPNYIIDGIQPIASSIWDKDERIFWYKYIIICDIYNYFMNNESSGCQFYTKCEQASPICKIDSIRGKSKGCIFNDIYTTYIDEESFCL